MSLKQKLMERMKELEIEPKRSMGQNFLISEHVVQNIIQTVQRTKPGAVIEIGPGLGSITDMLHADFPALRLVEFDSEIANYWKAKGLPVVEADALQLDWNPLLTGDKTVLVSNLPYQISSRLVIESCLWPKNLRYMVLMFQLEVAQRIQAKPSTEHYGFLSVVAQTYWNVDKIVDASEGDFFPQPKVKSRVLRFSRTDIQIGDGFVEFCKNAFVNRRKFLIKNFKAKEKELLAALQEMGFDGKVRAEELTVEQFQSLFRTLYEGK